MSLAASNAYSVKDSREIGGLFFCAEFVSHGYNKINGILLYVWCMKDSKGIDQFSPLIGTVNQDKQDSKILENDDGTTCAKKEIIVRNMGTWYGVQREANHTSNGELKTDSTIIKTSALLL